VNAFLTSLKDAIAAPGQGDLSEQLTAALELQKSRNHQGGDKLKALEAAQASLNAADINADDKTELTPELLSTDFNSVGDAIKAKTKAIEAEISRASENNISPEKLQEFKEMFEHFDRNNNGSLNLHEFAGCLTSLGEEKLDAEVEAIVKQLDKNGTGTIQFPEFIDFMVKVSSDQDSEDEIVNSFKVLTNDADFITEAQMREVMSPEEVAYLTANMPPLGGGYDYKSWTSAAFRR